MLGVREPEQVLKQIIWRVFSKTHGLTLQTEAVDCLKRELSMASYASEQELTQILGEIAAAYKKQPGRSNLVDAESLNSVILGMKHINLAQQGGQGSTSAKSFVHISNAADCPRWDYDPHQKQFHQVKEHRPKYIGSAESRLKMFRRRYEIIKQRILRTEEFSTIDGGKLSTIKSVKGQKSGDLRMVLGMLKEMREGQVFFEDPEDFVRLEFQDQQFIDKKCYTEGTFVLVGGIPCGDYFSVRYLTTPPVELRSTTMKLASHPDLYSGLRFADSKQQLLQMESQYKDSSIVVVSDVWLDCQRTMGKLDQLFAGFDGIKSIPAAIVIAGPFLSQTHDQASAYGALLTCFSNLAIFLQKYRNLQRSTKFIFMPSLSDALGTGILPRAPIPEDVLSPLLDTGFDCYMASNPTRIFFFSKEIVFFRSDATIKMRKAILHPLQNFSGLEDVDIFKTMLEQSHLSPLPSSSQLIASDFDHSLMLYPTPDMLVVSERSVPRQNKTSECICVNPGSFATADFSFSLFYPLQNKVESLNAS